jgi:hypothetical protein
MQRPFIHYHMAAEVMRHRTSRDFASTQKQQPLTPITSQYRPAILYIEQNIIIGLVTRVYTHAHTHANKCSSTLLLALLLATMAW